MCISTEGAVGTYEKGRHLHLHLWTERHGDGYRQHAVYMFHRLQMELYNFLKFVCFLMLKLTGWVRRSRWRTPSKWVIEIYEILILVIFIYISYTYYMLDKGDLHCTVILVHFKLRTAVLSHFLNLKCYIHDIYLCRTLPNMKVCFC
jgi:hypothetical protein